MRVKEGLPQPSGPCRRIRMALLAALLVVLSVGGRGAPVHAATHPGYEPSQLATAYNVTPLWRHGLTGKGQTIAFMEVDGVDPQDVTHFDKTFGLPSAQLDVYVPANASEALAPGPETTMDVEWAHALAPDAHLQVYEIIKSGDFSNYKQHLADMLQAALAQGATVISISLRGTGSVLCSTIWAALTLHKVFQQVADKGVSVFVASGDYGDRPCQTRHSRGTVYPAADPYVTAVGGTRLTLNSDDTYRSETAWPGSGGGTNSDFGRPSWQRGPGSFDSTYRGVPDVAFDADPRSGVLVYLQGQWLVEGGTSLGAPCWAALWALAEQQHEARTHHALGWANPLLYGLANSSQRNKVFHDVTTGSNGYWQAGPGWDDVTGWGSPNAAALVSALTP